MTITKIHDLQADAFAAVAETARQGRHFTPHEFGNLLLQAGRDHGPALLADAWSRGTLDAHTLAAYIGQVWSMVEDVRPDAAARKRLRRAGAEDPNTVRYVTLRQSARPTPEDDHGARDTASRVYRHQWFVKPHRRTYPDQDDPRGYSRKWVGPYLVTPAGCENAPILGRERIVSVLRR